MSQEIDVAKSTEIANVDAMLAAKAAALQQNIVAAGNHISLRDKKFGLPSGIKSDGPVKLVILDYRFQNRYYDKPWDPDTPTPPVCYAISETNVGMKPSDKSTEKQAESCDTCPLNEYGSKGKGKACRNQLIMAVQMPDLSDDTVMTITASPTAQTDMRLYLKKVTDLYGHPVKAVTSFTLVDAPRGFKLRAAAADVNTRYADHVKYLQQAEAAVTAEPQAAPPDDDVGVQAAPKSTGPATRRSAAT